MAALLIGVTGIAWSRRGGVLVLAACLVGGSVSGTLAMADEDKRWITASDVKLMLGMYNPDMDINTAGFHSYHLRNCPGNFFLNFSTHLAYINLWF